ncbi:MAG: tetratricopeptide repeat protein [Flavobacteriaceae bacterium]
MSLLALAAALLLAATPLRADTRAKLTTRVEQGYARLILDFPKDLPEYEVRASSGVLIVEFGEAVEISADLVAINLPGYVSVARVDPDKRALRLALDRTVSVNTMEAGSMLFVDLLPSGWVGLPPGLPQSVIDELAKRAEETERDRLRKLRDTEMRTEPAIDLRVAQAPTFTRFSFGWTRPARAEVTRTADTVTIQFERAAPIDVDAIKPRLPDYVTGISTSVEVEGLRVVLNVNPTANIRGFPEGNSYVLDVTDTEATAEAGGPDIPGGIVTASPTPGDEIVHIEGEKPPVSIAESELETAAEPAGDEKAAQADEPEGSENPFEAAQRIEPEVRRIGETVRITVPFRRPTPAAVFRRGEYLWLVFDTPVPIDTRVLRYDMADYASDVTVSRSGDSQAIRMKLIKPILASSAVENSNWVISIGNLVLEPAAAVSLARTHSVDGLPAITATVTEGGGIHYLDDPSIGDRLYVLTALGPPRAILSDQHFVDFEALATWHGIVIAPKVDDLVVRYVDDVLSIESERGLTLSAVGSFVPEELGARKSGIERPGYVYNQLVRPQDPGEIRQMASQWMTTVAAAEGEKLTAARMGYAEYLLSTDLAPEAMAVLQLTRQDAPEVARDPGYRALTGVALTRMHRSEEALKTFDFYGLKDSADVQLWSGLAMAQLGRWREAQLSLEKGAGVLADYPAGDRLDFMLASLRAAIEVNDLGNANDLVAMLRSEKDVEGNVRYDYLRARLDEALGEREKALNAYGKIVEGPSREYSVLAETRRLRLLDETGAIDATDMISRLETLSVAWRGDDTELQTLSTLSRFYVKEREYRNAFETMRAAAIAGPGRPITRELQDSMQAVFADLYLNGGADTMKPIDALALYYDYRELTPVGRRGDEMIRALADRLIAVDLLGQASDILAHQVEHRLRGAARAQVAAKLAMVYLMDRKPQQALRTLALTRQAMLPGEVQMQRMLLEARALSETGRADLAIDLLRSAQGPEAARLRADTYWRARRWQEAGEALEELAGDGWRDKRPLTPEERRDVVRAAIAYALIGDEIGLARLREHFADKMADTPDAGTFAVVAAPVEKRGPDFRAVAATVARSDTLEGFIREYRQRYDRQAAVPQS